MKIFTRTIFRFYLFIILSSCSTTSQVGQYRANAMPTTANNSNVIRVEQSSYQENQYVNIDMAIFEGTKYLASRILEGSKIAVVAIQAPTANLSNYVVDSISMHLVNENKSIVIERAELDTIRNEQMYQASGEVSDETAVSIGKQIGAKFIVTGSILPLGNKYSFRIKIIDAETAQNYGTKIFQFNQDRTILALLEPPAIQEVEKQESTREEVKQTPVINGDINITNNTTTTINGDVYINMPKGLGW
jgi:TolB-like protein